MGVIKMAAAPPASDSVSAESASKYCPSCARSLPSAAFQRDRSKGDGLRSRCRECLKPIDRARREMPENRISAVARQYFYRKAHAEKIKAQRRARYSANKAKVLEQQKQWRAAHKAEVREYGRRARDKAVTVQASQRRGAYLRRREELLARLRSSRGTEAYHERRLLKSYGIDYNDFCAIFAEQRGLCLGCGKPMVIGGHHGAQVDHCHETQRVRGVLCRECNLALGHCYDNPATLRRLAQYVEMHRRGE